MKNRHPIALVLMLAVAPGVAAAGDTVMVKNIARHTGIPANDVVAVLGGRMGVAECEYAWHPSRRGEIQRMVVRGQEMMAVAARNDAQSREQARRKAVASIDR